MPNFLTVRFLKTESEQNFGFPHIPSPSSRGFRLRGSVKGVLRWRQDQGAENRGQRPRTGWDSLVGAARTFPPAKESAERAAVSSPAGFGAEPRPPKGFSLFSALSMASPDTIILLIVDYHAAIEDRTPCPPCVRPWLLSGAFVRAVRSGWASVRGACVVHRRPPVGSLTNLADSWVRQIFVGLGRHSGPEVIGESVFDVE